MFVCETTRKMILIDNIEKVKSFVEAIAKCPVAVDLVAGRFTVDAKSLMGVFSLDVSRPVEIRIHDNTCIAKDTLDSISDYIVGEAPEITDPYAKT
ncbi:HPr family phosphocarrier protein [bacterium]|nr:HPr family phosphocarrier protein [bacterium]